MATTPAELATTYEELTALEKEFEDVEVELIRQQVALTKPLYEKRQIALAQIPRFWPLVIEQAPPEIDQYVQPSDSAVLLQSLSAISVSHFEIENGGKGDPRSISIRLEFNENEYFEDRVLEKKFWYRHGKDGYSGLVSEPVPIKWKAGKDLTSGLLDLVMTVWAQDKKRAKAGAAKATEKDLTPEQLALKKKIDNTSLDGMSFFAWFGYRGMDISEEESREAVAKDAEQRRLRAEGKEPADDEQPVEDNALDLEIFPDGDELAVAFSDELWPSAIKYFTQAQEQDDGSDDDFEDGDDDADDEEAPKLVDVVDDEPPAKKRKAWT